MTKLFYDGPYHRVGKLVSRLSRSDMTLLIHATTGHKNLNYINSINNPEYTPLCRFFCEEAETFYHLYDNCPVLWKQGCKIQGDQTSLKKWTVKTVLNMAKLEDILLAMQINITEDIVKNRRQ